MSVRKYRMTKYRLMIALLWGIGVALSGCLVMNLNGPIGLLLIPGGVIAFAVPLLLFHNTRLERLRRIAGWSTFPVAVLGILACFPSLNPLFPHGMAELAKEESELQNAIPLGMSLEQTRGELNSRKIQFEESTQVSDGVVLQSGETVMNAQSGDTVLVSRFPTDASEFPCGFDMQIVLLFGHDRSLKQRYIQRFRICP